MHLLLRCNRGAPPQSALSARSCNCAPSSAKSPLTALLYLPGLYQLTLVSVSGINIIIIRTMKNCNNMSFNALLYVPALILSLYSITSYLYAKQTGLPISSHKEYFIIFSYSRANKGVM